MAHDASAKIITNASGGRALKGNSIGLPLQSQEDGARTSLDENMGKQVLLHLPPDISLMGPAKPSVSMAFCFSSVQQSASFSRDVIDKGWTLATEIHRGSPLWIASSSPGQTRHHLGRSGTDQRVQHKLSEVYILHCIYQPTKSFQIPRNKMVLSRATVDRARAIENATYAHEFLKVFNPFVSQGLYHLGGIFQRQVTVKLRDEGSLLDLWKQTQKELSGKAGANVVLGGGAILDLGGSVKGLSNTTKTEEEVSQASSFKVIEGAGNVMICGPTSARSAKEFQQMMATNDSSSWSVIDKDVDGERSLVAVWELLINPRHNPSLAVANKHEDGITFKRVAKMLCEHWLYLQNHGKSSITSKHHLAAVSTLDQQRFEVLLSQLTTKAKTFLSNLCSSDPRLSKSQLMPSSPVLPLDVGPRKVTLASLVQTLQELCDSDQVNEATELVVQRIREFILSNSTSESANAKVSQALIVLRECGFDMKFGNHLQNDKLDADSIRSIREDLMEILHPSRPLVQQPIGDWRNAMRNMDALGRDCEGNSKPTFRYVGDVVVDRNNDYLLKKSQELRVSAARRYIDCLRHRLNPREHPFLSHLPPTLQIEISDEEEDDDWGLESEDEGEEGAAAAPSSTSKHSKQLQAPRVSQLEMLVDIFQHSELPLQMEVGRLLLSQRASTLVIFPRPAAAGGEEVSLKHCIEAFRFTKVVVQDEKKLRIHLDLELPRAVFVSEKEPVSRSLSATVASRVMQCDFISQHDRREMCQNSSSSPHIFPTIELGVGFIESGQWLCFQVTGSYRHPQIMQFIETIADVVVLELKEARSDFLTPKAFWRKEQVQNCAKVLNWRVTDGDEGSDSRRMVIWGQETHIVRKMQKSLASMGKKMSEKPKARISLVEACTRHFTGTDVVPTSMHDQRSMNPDFIGEFLRSQSWNFSEMRQQLLLQKSLVAQGAAFWASHSLKDDPLRKQRKDQMCRKETEYRKQSVKTIMGLPIVCLFHQILSQDDAMRRIVGIMSLENSISEAMRETLVGLASAVDSKYVAYARDMKDMELRKGYLDAKQAYVDKSIGIDNLWRELCHILEADPEKQRGLATLAAQHLLDGFPLEVFDGDAGMFCKTWVGTVLTELHTLLSARSGRGGGGGGRNIGEAPARLFVLSVMGLQSSGKSTMLNLMFGTRLPTSAGRCTRGVFMQLVPSERPEYDYIVLLDTEGLRSNEFHGLEDSVARDNRLATFGLLPADACILLVSNEDDGALKEVLPMVLLAFKSSSIAEEHGGRIKAKMVFVYRSVDTNDKSKLKGNTQKLHECLMDAAMEVSRMAGQSITAEQISKLVFSDMQVAHKAEYGGSDVWFMGNLKRGHIPPNDTPEWDYGKDVLKLREYVHRRVTSVRGWKATSPAALAEQLRLVWECICSADFELNFRSRVEYNAYMELQKALQPLKTAVAEKYANVFTELEKTLRRMDSAEEDSSMSGMAVVEHFEWETNGVVKERSKEVSSMLEQPRWAKWKAQSLEEWKSSCDGTREWYKKRVEDLVSGVVKYERVLTEYENRCKSTIVTRVEKGEWKLRALMDEGELERKFEEIFQSILLEAANKYPPVSANVRGRVMDRYKMQGLTQRFDLYQFGPVHSGGGQSLEEDATTTTPGTGLTALGSRLWSGITQIFGSSNPSSHRPEKMSQRGPQQLQQLSKLEQIVDCHVRDVKQFSEVVVDGVIKETSAEIERLSKQKQKAAHLFVIQYLVSKLEDIQGQWDKEHNVSEKLRHSARPRLLRFFKAKVQGLEATALLIKDLQHILEDELKEALLRVVVNVVTSKVGREDWSMDWREMRNLLDFHLLVLMEKAEHTERLISFVRDESHHFQRVTDALIKQLMDQKLVEDEWRRLLHAVAYCLKQARSGGESADGGDLKAYMAVLKPLLADRVDPKLAQVVATSTSDQAHYRNSGTKDNLVLDADFYDVKIPGLCRCLQEKPAPQIIDDVSSVVRKVKERMVALANDHCRRKCEAACPTCRSSCFHPMGHRGATHDCIHQPGGLHGQAWHHTHELCEKTCLQQVEAGNNIVFDDGARRIPYRDFEKEYPQWKLPSSSNPISLRVRESIFFKYNHQLAEHYSRLLKKEIKPCPPEKMPTDYDHDIQQLRAELFNKLKASKLSTSVEELSKLFLGL